MLATKPLLDQSKIAIKIKAMAANVDAVSSHNSPPRAFTTRRVCRAGYSEPPNVPFVDGTSSALRQSMVIALRKARANALKQDSIM